MFVLYVILDSIIVMFSFLLFLDEDVFMGVLVWYVFFLNFFRIYFNRVINF